MKNMEQIEGGLGEPVLVAKQPNPRGARVAVWVTLVLVVLHVSAIAIWVGPDNLMRRKVGVDRLSHYVLPMFDQNWSVFAPEADFGNDLLTIRATVKTAEGTEKTTPWVKVTEREIVPAVKYHPFPSRTAAITNRLASEHSKVWEALSTPQKDAVGASAANVSLDDLRAKLNDLAQDPNERAAATNYMKVETAIEYFLSGIAKAIWGDDLVSFQIFRSRVLATNYETRKKQRLIQSSDTFTSNWRPPHALDKYDLPTFRAYVDKFDIR